MATHFGGVGNTSMENLEMQDIDNSSEDKSHNENIIQNFASRNSASKTISRG